VFVGQIPRQLYEHVIKYAKPFALRWKVSDQTVDFRSDLFTGRERVNIPFRLVKLKTLEVVQDFAPQKKSVVRVIAPIQFTRPFARILKGA